MQVNNMQVGQFLRYIGVVVGAQFKMLERVTANPGATPNMTILALQVKDNRPEDGQVAKYA